MAILNAKLLPKGGPYIEFAVLPKRIKLNEVGNPMSSAYKKHIFYEFADDLTGVICTVLHCWFPLEQHELLQYSRASQIYGFSSTILELAAKVSACPERHFHEGIWIYENSLVDAQHRTAQHLKEDLLETLLFIADNANRAAKEGKCLVIVGF